MVRYMGDTILSISIIGNNINLSDISKFSKRYEIEFLNNFCLDNPPKGLIISEKLNSRTKIFVKSALKNNIPILAYEKGFTALVENSINLPVKKNNEQFDYLFLSPGAKISHIIGGSGWIKTNFLSSRELKLENLPESFFGSIISKTGNIIAYERSGNVWIFGISWDIFDSIHLPKGFNKIFTVFIDKCYNN